MHFKKIVKPGEDPGEEINVPLYRRGVLAVSGSARYEYRHGIRERKTELYDGARHPRELRISITLRKIIRSPDTE